MARRRCSRKRASCASPTTAEELRENRRGEVELFAHPALALARSPRRSRASPPRSTPTGRASLRDEHLRRASQLRRRRSPERRPARTATCTRTASSPRCSKVLRARCDHHRRRRRHPELRAHGTRARARISTPAPSAASASACPTASPRRCCIPIGRSCVVTGDGAFGINAMEIDIGQASRRQGRVHRRQQRGLEHRAARPGDELRRTRRRHDAGSGPTTPRWRARSACTPSA